MKKPAVRAARDGFFASADRAGRAAACLAIALVAGTALAAERYTRSQARYEVPAVTLTDARGAAVALVDELARPEPVLLQLMFTSCATVCPVLTGTVAAAEERLPGWRLLSISIDPEADTPAKLAEYAARLGAGERWRFLTGEAGDLRAVEQAFDAYRGGKMRHLPLTFLRAGPAEPWLRLEGFPSAAELAQEAARLLAQ